MLDYEKRIDEDCVRRAESLAAMDKQLRDTTKILTAEELRRFRERVRPVDQIGQFIPEKDDPNVLIYGPWLERGAGALVVSTAGTGKSTHCMQFVHSMAAGVPFQRFTPRTKLRVWVFQTEDSPRRVEQDRLDSRDELAEQFPETDWEEASERVKFCEILGSTGTDFLTQLSDTLSDAQREQESPDVVVLNPFMAFIGGPINDSQYVTPFLRGGEINGKKTWGLQRILKEFLIATLLYHHTAKPPPEKDLKAWVQSSFSEYQGAGSSDLTNWVRSVIVMTKVFEHHDWRVITASKNGGELGWERLADQPRTFLAYSRERGVSGKGRHAWRELDEDEMEVVRGIFKKGAEDIKGQVMTASGTLEEPKVERTDAEVAESMREWIRKNVAVNASEMSGNGKGRKDCFTSCVPHLTQRDIRRGGRYLMAHYKEYQMQLINGFYGYADSHKKRRDEEETKRRLEESMQRAKATYETNNNEKRN